MTTADHALSDLGSSVDGASSIDIDFNPSTLEKWRDLFRKDVPEAFKNRWNGEYGKAPGDSQYNLDQLGPCRPSLIVLYALLFMLYLEELTGRSAPFGLSEVQQSADYPQPEQADCLASGSQDGSSAVPVG